MNKIFSVIAVIMISFVITNAQDTCFNYMLKGEVGTKTVLSVYSSSGKVIGAQTIEIISKENINDTTFVKYRSTTTGMGTIKLEYMTKCSDTVAYIELKHFLNVAQFVDSKVTTITPMWLCMPFEYKEGQELEGYVMYRSYGNSSIITKMKDRKVSGFETVTTPVGDFECVKITYTIEGTTSYGVFTSFYADWYHEDLGLIKQESYKADGSIENSFLLKSFDVVTPENQE